jgi:hypothetical protein
MAVGPQPARRIAVADYDVSVREGLASAPLLLRELFASVAHEMWLNRAMWHSNERTMIAGMTFTSPATVAVSPSAIFAPIRSAFGADVQFAPSASATVRTQR